MRLPGRRKKSGSTPGGSRDSRTSGCLGVVVEIAVWVFSTLLITIGVSLLLVGILDFTPENRTRTIVALVIAPVAIALFIWTGRAILRDLRGKQPPKD